MIGFESLRQSFQNLAQKDLLGHGFIFFGPEGVGKKTFALALAHYLESGDFNETAGWGTDLKVIYPKGKTIGIDEAREVRGYLSQTPLRSKKKVVIIDNAHAMTVQAQNALLKIVEEPPEHSLIIFITHDFELLLPTLYSRLPKVYFTPPGVTQVVLWLKDKGVEEPRAQRFAKRARGAPGLAWRYEFDEDLGTIYERATALLRMSSVEVKTALKSLSANEDFDVLALLDALIVMAKEEGRISQKFIRTALTMRREAATFNLNSRLQLEYLLSLITQ